MAEFVIQKETWTPVQKAFSRQSDHFDADDLSNPILLAWRQKIYAHVERFMPKNSRILELNAGTGIDALHFVRAGHSVLATDIAAGMIDKIKDKIILSDAPERFIARPCSFESLHELQGQKFDYVFSNFGGLNCCSDLGLVTRDLAGILRDGAIITWVIMPRVSLWELTWIFKGKRAAFRRFNKNGSPAHLEGEIFTTHYHSLATIRKKLGNHFQLVQSEGLGALSPPPASMHFTRQYPAVASILRSMDEVARFHFPFNRWADHLIVTFRYSA